ncbi:MAG: glycosyltransferase family 4 protein [Xanthobacteraceae bacterium]|nr:glycosyltransferase family 4 protein [Xanthobacteraceae bacterium]
MSLKIAQVVAELSNAGGIETVAFELARAFSRAGVDNAVVTATVGRAADPGTSIDRVAPWLSSIPTRGPLRYLGRIVVFPVFTLAATLALRRHRSAVVISHGDSLTGDVLVVHAVNAQNLIEKRRARSWLWTFNPMHLWVGLRERWMIGGLRYGTYVAVSPRVATELTELYAVPPARIRVIPNGIDLERFTFTAAARTTIRREFGIPETAKVLLFAGHEFGRKGLAHAIGALDRLGDDVWLLVAGSDNSASYRKLATRSAARLVFAGARSDMPALYSAADAFVLPTTYETFSLVCMEAMACSLPVFATPVGGIENYLVDGKNGHTIEMRADDIAAKIDAALSEPRVTAELRKGARATALDYGWDRVAAQYVGLAGEIAASKSAAQIRQTSD